MADCEGKLTKIEKHLLSVGVYTYQMEKKKTHIHAVKLHLFRDWMSDICWQQYCPPHPISYMLTHKNTLAKIT